VLAVILFGRYNVLLLEKVKWLWADYPLTKIRCNVSHLRESVISFICICFQDLVYRLESSRPDYVALENVQVFARLWRTFRADANPSQDVSSDLKRVKRTRDSSGWSRARSRVPRSGVLPFLAGLASLLPQPHLLEDADEQLVDVVLDASRRLDELHFARSRQTPALWKWKDSRWNWLLIKFD
jgi:hypothetical protein